MTRTFVHLNVDRAPPDVILAGLFVDDTLVLGAPAGLLTGEVDESTGGGDDGALVFDGIFVELGGGGVALQLDAIHVEASLGEVVEVTTDDCLCHMSKYGTGGERRAYICCCTHCRGPGRSCGGGCGE